MTKYFVNADGVYIGGFDGAEPPANSVEVPDAPIDARQMWTGGVWGPVPIGTPDRVTARQFKLQLLSAGLLDQVESWVATQPKAVQIAYANSGTFVRGEPMMRAGFAALGVTSEQGDAFFAAAAAL